MGDISQIIRILPKDLVLGLDLNRLRFDKINEIRIRVGRYIALIYDNKEVISRIKASKEHIRKIIELAADYSVYAYEQSFNRAILQ